MTRYWEDRPSIPIIVQISHKKNLLLASASSTTSNNAYSLSGVAVLLILFYLLKEQHCRSTVKTRVPDSLAMTFHWILPLPLDTWRRGKRAKGDCCIKAAKMKDHCVLRKPAVMNTLHNSLYSSNICLSAHTKSPRKKALPHCISVRCRYLDRPVSAEATNTVWTQAGENCLSSKAEL